MPSATPVNATDTGPSRAPPKHDANTPPRDGDDVPVTEEDIGTEGSGTEPPVDTSTAADRAARERNTGSKGALERS
jgi:hypothetical protein